MIDLMPANKALITARRRLGLSQDELARRLRDRGYQLGSSYTNECNRANISRWENKGAVPQPHYVYLLEDVLGESAESLGFAYVEHGMDRDQMLASGGLDTGMPVPDPEVYNYGSMTGIWLSEYEYHSDSRDDDFIGRHYVQLLQRGQHLVIRALPNHQYSRLSLELSLNGNMAKGTWTELTNPNGYYKGAVYDGAIQLGLNQEQNRLKGMWVGFGRNPGEMNTGPWKFDKCSDRVDTAAREEWDVDPPSAGER
jgi:transcriptional regulator with XRE-family HTH domain